MQDADYIAGLADRSAAHVTEAPPWPTRCPRTLRRELRDTLLSRCDTHGKFPDGRQYRLDDLAVRHDGHVLRARLRLDDGQTALVDLRIDPTAGSGRANHDHHGQPSRQPQPGSEQPASSAAAHSAQREAGVILATRNLARSAAFYAQLTGRDIPVLAGTAEITPGLLLHQSAADTLIDATSVIVHITVDNLPATARRLGLDTTTTNGHTTTIEVRDPDGRTVRISQHPASSRPDY